MAAVTTAPGLPSSRLHLDSDSLSTLRDPRSPLDEFPSPTYGSAASSPHPDLNVEVATLSNKLISAINHQTHLDDALAATRHELEAERKRCKRLDELNNEHQKLIATGQLVRREDVDDQVDRYAAKLAEERRQRSTVERDKKGIEQELENLTTALFEEANEMVAAARKEREASERRNEQLRTQLKDTELLLTSHQEQLAELKSVMSQMSRTKDDLEQATNSSTTPSTPALQSQADIDNNIEDLHSVATSGLDGIPPAPPTSFTHLLSPVLRTDLASYEDFKSLVDISRKSAPSSRVNSGSYGGLNMNGPASSSSLNMQQSSQSAQMNSGSHSSSQYATNSHYSSSIPVIPLKETKFYKRALAEDIDPTMRLDTAPGLSWLARRTVISSMCEGSLVVEPVPTSTRMSVFSCSLCGENRKGVEFARTHRFRTSESENAQRYPLCEYCLNRVRATCDFLGFLRMVKDGHWRAENIDAERVAWEESVRLRERMFWSRIGGGVIPAFIHRDSPRSSTDATNHAAPMSAPPTVFSHAHAQHQLAQENERKRGMDPDKAPVPTTPSSQPSSDKGDVQVGGVSSVPNRQMREASPGKLDLRMWESMNHTADNQNRSRAMSQETQTAVTPKGALTPHESRSRGPSPSRSKGELGMSIPGGFD